MPLPLLVRKHHATTYSTGQKSTLVHTVIHITHLCHHTEPLLIALAPVTFIVEPLRELKCFLLMIYFYQLHILIF